MSWTQAFFELRLALALAQHLGTTPLLTLVARAATHARAFLLKKTQLILESQGFC